MMLAAVVLSVALLGAHRADAHLAAYSKGMYCANGFKNGVKLSGYDAMNSNSPVTPLYQLSKDQWWFHNVNGCPSDPPPDGEFLELPAGKSFSVEIASNRGKTSLSFNGDYTSDWPDGQNYPEDYHVDSCIISPNMHTQNHENAAGTAFAISYESDMSKVTAENLVVFSVRYHTPWKRVTHYDVPAAMPACPKEGCICAWGWVPKGCGQPNMYHQGYRCKVTGASSTTPVAQGKPPVWCEGDEGKCTKGAKQMIYWHQASGNNIEVSGSDQSGADKSPPYNMKLGFRDGAQNDIFTGSPSSSSSPSSESSPSESSSDNSNSNKNDSGSSPQNAENSNGSPGFSRCKKRALRSSLTGRNQNKRSSHSRHNKRMHHRDFS